MGSNYCSPRSALRVTGILTSFGAIAGIVLLPMCAALTAQGVYSGRTSAGITFETIVLPNDKLYAIYGPGSGNTFYGTGIVTGQGTSNNGQYTANITDYYYTGLVTGGTVSASYVAGSSINGILMASQHHPGAS